ncbi:MAG: acyl-CoA/acyl-ACP dehydrogenase [Chloroflexi bacterium]|nr:acyl-CoA/acyl-ACP dehydrogenase [Chloroflexota bacterium]MDA1004072.1 acyl-CoA/acyl-ACP dehydrogenase [Chloroflexota bacterium]
MDLGLSETQELLKNAARDFLENECPEALVREMEEDEKGYSPQLWQKMAEQGWQGLLIPEEHGGAGFDFLDLCVLLEEFGRALVPGPFMSTVLGGAVPLMTAGSDAQKAEFLPKIASGDLIFTLALTEPSARFDEQGVQCAATVSGNDVTFSGTKLFVSDANVADYLVVAGRSSAGITLGIVPTDQAGVVVTPLQTIARDKQAEVKLNNAKGQLLGADGQGWALLAPVIERYTIAECAYLVGLSQMDFEISVDYAKERVQFGRPIGSFQAIQHKCADMVTDVDGSRFIMYKAAWSLATDQPADETRLAVNMAKAWTSEATRRVVAHGQQIHGGIGFTKDYKIQLYFRRQKRAELAFGDADYHRELVAQQLGI